MQSARPNGLQLKSTEPPSDQLMQLTRRRIALDGERTRPGRSTIGRFDASRQPVKQRNMSGWRALTSDADKRPLPFHCLLSGTSASSMLGAPLINPFQPTPPPSRT